MRIGSITPGPSRLERLPTLNGDTAADGSP
jgi:hypothetical protein